MHGNRTAPSGSDAALASARSSETQRGSRRLRSLLVANDMVATAIGWSMVALASGHSSLWSPSRLASLPAFVLITSVLIAANKLYRARVCSVRALEMSTMFRAAFGLEQALGAEAHR